MKDPMPKKSSRSFSKRLVLINVVLVWALMFASVFFRESEHVVNGGFALIGTLFGIYTGIGHLDFRKAVQLSLDQIVKGGERK